MRQLNSLQGELLVVDGKLGIESLNSFSADHRIRQMDGTIGVRLRSGPGRMHKEVHFSADWIVLARDCQDLSDIGIAHLHTRSKGTGIDKTPSGEFGLQVEPHAGFPVTQCAIVSNEGAWRKLDLGREIVPTNLLSRRVCGCRYQNLEVLGLQLAFKINFR